MSENNPIENSRRTLSDAMRKAADLADDTAEYGADVTDTGVMAVTGIGKGLVRIPASLLRKVADLVEGGSS